MLKLITLQVAQLISFCKNLKKIDATNVHFDEESASKLIANLAENYEFDSFDCRNCGFTDVQVFNINLLLQRNKFYKDNPILKKDHFTFEDEIALDRWCSRLK